jgi:hypothetical protein
VYLKGLLEEVTGAPLGELLPELQPETTPGARATDFAEFAEFAGWHPDPLSQTFSAHLLNWRAQAGSSERL